MEDKETISKVMSQIRKEGWAKVPKEDRIAHAKMMVKAREDKKKVINR